MDHNIFILGYTTPVWKDDNISTLALSAPGNPNAPDIGTLDATNIRIPLWDTGEEVSSVIEINHDYQEGTLLYPHLHISPTTTGSGTIVFSLEYSAREDNDIVGATISKEITVNNQEWEEIRVEFTPIDLSAVAFIGTQFHFRLYRDVDTYSGDVATSTIGFHYLTNTRGSRQIATK